MQFNKRDQPIGIEGRVLASFLGTIERNPDLAPVHIPDWRILSKKDKIVIRVY